MVPFFTKLLDKLSLNVHSGGNQKSLRKALIKHSDNNTIDQSVNIGQISVLAGPAPAAETSRPKLSKLTPQEIRSDVEARPPRQRQVAYDAYIGRVVTWAVNLHSVSEPTYLKGRLRITMIPKGSLIGNPMIIAEVPDSKYPELNTAKEGQELVISGKIATVGPLGLDLADSSIYFE